MGSEVFNSSDSGDDERRERRKTHQIPESFAVTRSLSQLNWGVSFPKVSDKPARQDRRPKGLALQNK